MPKYELMYIIGSSIADDEIPKLAGEIKQFIESSGAVIEKHEDLGKRKLAYPIKKTKNGNYILVSFETSAEKIETIAHKLRTTLPIIRHLIVNMDEALVRMEKDRVVQSQMKPRRPELAKVEGQKTPDARQATASAPSESAKKISIDLDAEIEKAIGADNN